MSPVPHVLQFLVVAVAGWINQQQRDVIDYLQEESRPPRAARSWPSPVHRRPAPAPGRKGQEPRADGYSVTCTPWSRPRPSSAGIDS